MKFMFKKLALIFFATVCLMSCNDDETTTPDNKLILGETSYKIGIGAFIKDETPNTDDDGDNYHRNELVFLTDGLSITDDVSLTGTGNIVDLMINNVGTELQAGTYTWEDEANEQPFDFWAGYITLNHGQENEIEYVFTSGTLVITKSGTTYKATLEGTAIHEDFVGEPIDVKIQFEGGVQEYTQNY